MIITYIYVKAASDIDVLLENKIIKHSSKALESLKKRKIWLIIVTIPAVVLCFLPFYTLISYHKHTEQFTEWYSYIFCEYLWMVLMIIFLAIWTTALVFVYKKIKATGQTAPNKGIFIAHIVLVLLYILT